MTSVKDVLKHAAMVVKPSLEEERRLESLAASLLSKTRDAAKSYSQVHDVILGGSFAKDTWLPRDVDIDIFVRIASETNEREFERIGLAIGARVAAEYPRGKKYAQHPYTEATIGAVKVNIVPCYDVEPQHWKSAADRSPYHLRLVERMPDSQKLQVRLLKKFMKGIGVYGAEIESQGFSGYAAEVLVIRCTDFEGVLGYFADFKPYSEEEFFHLSDPVDENRDLARAVSPEKVARMVLASRAFLRKPTPAYFGVFGRKKRPLIEPAVVGLVFSHSLLSEDTLWGELKKTLKHMEAHIEAKDFKVARATAVSNTTDSSAFLFLPEIDSLPELELRMGPTIDRRTETDEFISKNRRKAKLIWVGEDARVLLLQRRSRKRLVDLLLDTIKDVKKVGASKEMAAGIAKSGRVVSGTELSKLLSTKTWLRKGMDEIVSDTIGTGPA